MLNARKDLLQAPKRVVVKIGSAALTSPKGGLNLDSLSTIVADLAAMKQAGLEVVLVSSGAISTGRPFLTAGADKNDISYLQAASAIGQPILMAAYARELEKKSMLCAQVLLTHDDLKHRTRQFNTRNALMQLLGQGILPILNENDSVSYAEITVGDNDQLAAMVAELIDADLLIVLTGPDGLYDRDPAESGAVHFPVIAYHDDLKEIKTIGKSAVGRGGMATKLMAIKKLTPLGINVILGSYRQSPPIMRLLQTQTGTLFHAKSVAAKNRRKAWLFTTLKAKSTISVDEGAYRALCKNGSLLPIGIKNASGNFKRGDVIGLKYQGKIFAAGICEYDCRDVIKLIGKKSSEILTLLGSCPSDVIVHRDNMFIKDQL
jgi:glutamate 5-kinase